MMLLEDLKHLVLTYQRFQLVRVLLIGKAYQNTSCHRLQSEYFQASGMGWKNTKEPVRQILKSVVTAVKGTYAAEQSCIVLAA